MFNLYHSGECKDYMKVYLDCLRKNGSNSTPCRPLNRDYLDCRMNKYVAIFARFSLALNRPKGPHGSRRLEEPWLVKPCWRCTAKCPSQLCE